MKRALSHPLVALLFGLALRLFLLLKFPATAGDSELYENLAANSLKHHAYAVNLNGVLTSVDVRVPGYPAFLALLYAVTGRTGQAARLQVMVLQAVIDLLACLVIAAIASSLVKLASTSADSKSTFRVALWIAALCPFIANYSAVLLTETFAIFLTAISILLLVRLARSYSSEFQLPPRLKSSWDKSPEYWSALFGLAVGFATLFRPESPLLLIAAWLIFGSFLWRRHSFGRWFKLVAFGALSCAVALSPWIVRNAITLREFQPLAPKDATLPTEFVPRGFMAWEKTWLFRMSDCYAVTWKLNEESIDIADIPSRAFDSEQEKDRVAELLEQHNQNQSLSRETDAQFARIARERTARHPFRTYAWVPLQRILTIWFTPRIELLPFTGKVFPLAQEWDEDRPDLVVTVVFFFLNILYLIAALWGWLKLWQRSVQVRPALLAIAAYVLLRTAFLTTVEAPEPRYVLVCFPAILALATAAFAKRPESFSSANQT